MPRAPSSCAPMRALVKAWRREARERLRKQLLYGAPWARGRLGTAPASGRLYGAPTGQKKALAPPSSGRLRPPGRRLRPPAKGARPAPARAPRAQKILPPPTLTILNRDAPRQTRTYHDEPRQNTTNRTPVSVVSGFVCVCPVLSGSVRFVCVCRGLCRLERFVGFVGWVDSGSKVTLGSVCVCVVCCVIYVPPGPAAVAGDARGRSVPCGPVELVYFGHCVIVSSKLVYVRRRRERVGSLVVVSDASLYTLEVRLMYEADI